MVVVALGNSCYLLWNPYFDPSSQCNFKGSVLGISSLDDPSD